MGEQPERWRTSTAAAVLATVGGLLAVAGTSIGWFNLTAIRRSEIFGAEVVATLTRPGISDWTGVVAVLAGAVATIGAATLGLASQPRTRRVAAGVAIVGGLLVNAVSALALTRSASVLSAAVEAGDLPRTPDTVMEYEHAVAPGIVVAAAGGMLAVAGGVVAARTGPGRADQLGAGPAQDRG
jgi:hypothetical protein